LSKCEQCPRWPGKRARYPSGLWRPHRDPAQSALMSIAKTPINMPWGPSREPATGTTSIAVSTVPSHASRVEPFDFRSSRFCEDAQALVRATGQSLENCRKELFIAEGDVALAHELL